MLNEINIIGKIQQQDGNETWQCQALSCKYKNSKNMEQPTSLFFRFITVNIYIYFYLFGCMLKWVNAGSPG